MNRETRDKFVASTDQVDLYAESACLETPPDVFKALHDEFDFDLDLTANEHNHRLPQWLGPKGLRPDALDAPWTGYGHTGYSNPVYGDFIAKILPKARLEATQGFTSVFLLPLRVARWFKDNVVQEASELRFVDERIKFWYQGKPKPSARVPWSKKYANDPRYFICEGHVWHTAPHAPLLVPAGALFDSIIVVYRPRSSKLHFGPKVSVWHWNKARPCMQLPASFAAGKE